jgi:hypothetical protein
MSTALKACRQFVSWYQHSRRCSTCNVVGIESCLTSQAKISEVKQLAASAVAQHYLKLRKREETKNGNL